VLCAGSCRAISSIAPNRDRLNFGVPRSTELTTKSRVDRGDPAGQARNPGTSMTVSAPSEHMWSVSPAIDGGDAKVNCKEFANQN